jgi:hypothetical protein
MVNSAMVVGGGGGNIVPAAFHGCPACILLI